MSSAAGKSFVRRRGTTAIPNQTVHDRELSYTALGLLTVILGQPERAAGNGYRAYLRPGTGQAAILSAFKELEARGYRIQFKRKADKGRFVTDTVVSELPMTIEDARAYLVKKTGLDASLFTHWQKGQGASLSTHGEPRTADRARPHGAPSVPEDQGSLTSFLSKEPGESKKRPVSDLTPTHCTSCHRLRPARLLSASGVCSDCIQMADPSHTAKVQAGLAYRLELVNKRRARQGLPPLDALEAEG